MDNSVLSKTVCLKYFSQFAERTGKTTEEWLTEAITVEALWIELDKQYGFELDISSVRPAVNHQFCDWKMAINHRDIISFIPPVSGG
jgi:molybdopterin converting factor small subunit